MYEIIAEARTTVGTGSARALRLQKKIPAVIYGPNKPNILISIGEKEITRLYKTQSLSTTLIKLKLQGEEYNVLPKMVDLHKVTDEIIHIDFVYLEDTYQKVSVPIIFEEKDRCLGVKRGGFFNIIHRKIELLCPSNNIPKNIVINVGHIGIGDILKVSDLCLPEDCQVINKQNFIIASLIGRGGKDDTLEATPTKDKDIKTK